MIVHFRKQDFQGVGLFALVLLMCLVIFSSANAATLTINYTYDSLNRVTGADYNNGMTSITYMYDSAGNMTGTSTVVPGSIIIDPGPDSLNAPWTLTGPAGYSLSGTGDQTINKLAAGDYTVTWGASGSWTSPSNETKSLASGGSVTFTGNYQLIPVIPIPPANGSVGSTITISGTNFGEVQGSSYVDFNGVRGSIVSWSNTQIVVTVPSGATSGCMRIVTDYGTSGCMSFLVNASALDDGLVAHYPYNGNANDVSGYGNNGIVHGATLTTDRFGNADSAYLFNGNSNYIEVPNSNSLNITSSPLTISYWINWQNDAAYCALFGISKGGYDLHEGYELQTRGICGTETENGFSEMTVGNTTSYNVSVANANSYRNKWVHIVGVLKNDKATMYINGVAVGEASVPVPPKDSSDSSLYIGTRAPGNPYVGWLNGKIDEVRIYNRALSDSEIESLYTEGGWTGNPPSITSATSSTADGSYVVGTGINITLQFSKAVSSSGLTLTLSTGAVLSTGAFSSVTNWSGTYTIEGSQTTGDLTITSVAGTITDALSNSSVNPTIPAGQNIGDGKSIVIALNGVCGASNGGSFSTAPSSGLCSYGTASSVGGSGPWSWTCTGQNGGVTADCSAQASSQSGAVQLAKTGQTACYDESGTVTSCTGTGQDGEKQEGVAWPAPRFTDNGDSTLTDTLTGLIWPKDGKVPGPAGCSPGATKTWQGALDYVKCLNTNSYLGHGDWRLPNVQELKSVAHTGQSNPATWLNSQGFAGVQSSQYWTSSSYAASANSAWIVYMNCNRDTNYVKTNSGYAWPVRGGQTGGAVQLAKTGQTACYDELGAGTSCTGTGQDGEKQEGVAWPAPRFTDNGDSTLTDTLTGLIWPKDGKVPGPAGCSPGATKTWQGALDYVKCLNTNSYLGHSDWRLPNVNELRSLAHAGQSNPATWLNSQGFAGVQSSQYWTSSSYATSAGSGWIVYMNYGRGSNYVKTNTGYAWPVRTGQSGGAASSPSITSATSSTADGSYVVGTGINITLQFSKAVSSSGLTLTLSTGAVLSTGAFSSVTNWSGTYTIEGSQTTGDLTITSVAGTITDALSNSSVNPTIPAGQNIGDGKSIVIALNGVCGASNGGSFSTAPSSGLCSYGTASSVGGSGPWSWTCTGQNGGVTADCSAQASSQSGAVQLAKTGQTACYDESGTVTSCTGTGQDGEKQEGVAWPAPRFTDNGDSTLTDTLTGLIWPKDGKVPGPAGCSPGATKTWQGALDYVKCLNTNSYLGHGDWRLPNVQELKSVAHTGQSNPATWLNSQGFAGVQSSQYWTSSSYAASANSAWIVYMNCNRDTNYVKTNSGYAWPVRGGQTGGAVQLAKTGQTACYDELGAGTSCTGTGQDGEKQEGVAWPAPRFTDNGDSTLTDTLTGLIWPKDGKVPGPAGCSPGATKTWQGALDYVKCLNTNSYLGHSDWRLPNVNELRSLAHAGQSNPATWLNSQGFAGVQSSQYWTSSSYATSAGSGWIVYMNYGRGSNYVKTNTGYAWPVRTGQSGGAASSPSITSATSSTADGSYVVGTGINITLQFSKAVSSSGLTLTLSTGAVLSTGAFSSVTNWSGTYTIEGSQTTGDLTITSVAGTITDALSNSSVNPTIPAGQNIGDGKSIVIALNGVCGASNGGSFSTAPSSGLCSYGTASSVGGSGPWSWTCTGQNGGVTADCSAQASSQSGAVQLAKTGQTACYDESGTVTSCTGTGQDGEKQEGVAWPAPRFTDNGDSTLTDTLTGLIWPKDGKVPGPAGCSPGATKTWQGALDYVKCLNTNSYLGHGDWRLPNVQELKSVAHTGQSNPATWLNSQGFAGVQSSQYWTSSSYAASANSAWIVYMNCNRDTNYVKTNSGYAWPVRGGQTGGAVQLAKTGQTACYDELGAGTSCTGTGQDGEKQEGVAWPAPRFTDNGDSTLTDTLTGLIWPKDGKVPGPAGCSPGATKTWQGALDYVKCLNTNSYLGHSDWRLPNVNELRSLAHAGQSNPATWLNSQGFAGVQSSQYWTSSSYATSAGSGWIVYMNYGRGSNYVKTNTGYAWPVRGGK